MSVEPGRPNVRIVALTGEVETLQEEWSEKSEAFFESSKQNYWKILGKGKQAVENYAEEVELFEATLSQVVSKAAAAVSAKYETSLDFKTEVENKYRALRRVINPNRCQPVSFHYYQLMKKIRRELFFVEQTYHCVPPAGIAPPGPGLTIYRRAPGRPQNLHPKVVAPPPSWTIPESAGATSEASCIDPSAAPAESVIEVPFQRPATRQFTKKRAIAEVRDLAGEETAREMQRHLDQIDDLAEPGGGGLIFSQEICIGRTASTSRGSSLTAPSARTPTSRSKNWSANGSNWSWKKRTIRSSSASCSWKASRAESREKGPTTPRVRSQRDKAGPGANIGSKFQPTARLHR